MKRRLVQFVRRRARAHCEYCRLAQVYSDLTFEMDHIIPQSHGGPTTRGNLAFSCFLGNSFKGTNLAGLDRKTRAVVRLFHPRKDTWQDHFRWRGPRLYGLSPVGRATINVLRINLGYRVENRRVLIEEGVFPSPA